MLKIRKAEKTDIALIRSLALVAFPATYKNILTSEQIEYMLDWMYSPASLLKQFENGHIYHIAEFDGRACAYTSVEKQGDTLWHLQKIYILPEFQGKGFGRILFENAVAVLGNVSFAEDKLLFVQGEGIAKAAMEFSAVKAQDIKLNYLRLSQAERELKERTKK